MFSGGIYAVKCWRVEVGWSISEGILLQVVFDDPVEAVSLSENGFDLQNAS